MGRVRVLFTDLDGTCVHYDWHEWGAVAPRPDPSTGLWECTSLAAAEEGSTRRAALLRLPPSTSGEARRPACTWCFGEAAAETAISIKHPTDQRRTEKNAGADQRSIYPAGLSTVPPRTFACRCCHRRCLPRVLQARRASSPSRPCASMPRCASWE